MNSKMFRLFFLINITLSLIITMMLSCYLGIMLATKIFLKVYGNYSMKYKELFKNGGK